MSESDRSDAKQDKPASVPGRHDKDRTSSPKVRAEDKAKPDGEAPEGKARPDGEVIGELGDAVGGPA
jgi:hypothetical protein